jgi:very-short-patch-repair endonuclease
MSVSHGEAPSPSEPRPGAQSPGVHSRRIPWLAAVRFHKEIAARAERSFFSLRADEDQDERWTSLAGFEPRQMAGPWTVADGGIVSGSFALELAQRRSESVFLGGPCFLAYEQSESGSSWYPRWQPVMYREVRIERADTSFRVVPEQAHWSLSPLVWELFDKLHIALPTDATTLVEQILERAHTLHTNGRTPLHTAVVRAITSMFPALDEVLNRRPNRRIDYREPTPWVLFTPTSNFSVFTRNLMRDYRGLEEALALDETRIGGLAVLDGLETRANPIDDRDVLPLVPLNESQRQAVAAILSDRPVTVVSGPPGCGKSQVVLSVLLNSWARGKSVLFASNNNKAVDVVRERMERFEDQFPVAVRAGNKTVNNVVEVLRRTLNMAAGGTEQTDPSTFRRRRKTVERERANLHELLVSGRPARVEEALRGALSAYGRSQEIESQCEQAKKKLIEDAKQLRITGHEPMSVRGLCDRVQIWLESIDVVQERIAFDERERQALDSAAAAAANRRVESLVLMGLLTQPSDSGEWLLRGPQPTIVQTWIERLKRLAMSPNDESLKGGSWAEVHDDWRSSREAERDRDRILELASDIRATVGEIGATLDALAAAIQQQETARQDLVQRGCDPSADVPSSALQSWCATWAEWQSLPRNWRDHVPFSRRANLRRRLASLERELMSQIPSTVWGGVGVLDDVGRRKLADIAEALLRWERLFRSRFATSDARSAVSTRLQRLHERAVELRVRTPESDADSKAWLNAAKVADERARTAQDAAQAWSRRETRERFEQEIGKCASEWLSMAAGLPTKEAWMQRDGKSFDSAVRTLSTRVDAESIAAARDALHSSSVSDWLEAWSRAVEAQEEIVEAVKVRSSVPTRAQRAEQWLQGAPRGSFIVVEKRQGLPEGEARAIMEQQLNAVRAWCDRWDTFADIDVPRYRDEQRQERMHALERLAQVSGMLADEKLRDDFRVLERRAHAGEWEVSELKAVTASMDPSIIEARIRQIDAQLERGSFDDAKAAWLDRLQSDDEGLRAVNELERALARQHGEAHSQQVDAFTAALRLVPIWVTTAQAAQAIPLCAGMFDLVMIDEASQCTLTNLLPLVYRGRRLAVIGDSEQLPAIPIIRETEELVLARKLGVSAFVSVIGHVGNNVYHTAVETLPRRAADVRRLDEHYRSHPLIIGFSNQHIYQHRLKLRTARRVEAGRSSAVGLFKVPVRGEAKRGPRGRSWLNEPEAKAALEVVKRLRVDEGKQRSIGIVTPFTAQKELIREMLHKDGLDADVVCDSAYGFQGDERDVIVFSPVVAPGIDPMSARWVETPANLVNVALTRARDALYVVADFDSLQAQEGVLGKLANYCATIELLRSSSPVELELFTWMMLEGWSPRVHVRIGDHEADFVLSSANGIRVVVEVDGEQHSARRMTDASIDTYLAAQGYKVVRLPARIVREAPHEAIHLISLALELESERA